MRGRLEDARLLTGQGRYAADWRMAGEAHAAFLRADRAHADIESIDLGAALAAPGVLGVLRGEDLLAAGVRSLPTRLAVNGRDGRPLARPPRYGLAHKRVRFVGEPVAVVVAETAAQAQDAADLIGVDYRERDVVTTGAAALAPGAPSLHDEAPDNCVLDYGAGNEAATQAAFAEAHRVVRVSLHNTRVIGNPMEPRAFLASFDAAAGRFTVHSPTQGLNNLREQLCAAMGLEASRIVALAEEVGGGFGLRSNAYPEYVAVMAAARAFGRPVRWTASRSETFLADDQARDVASDAELALGRDDRFLAMRFSFLVNLGAYLTQTGPFISTQGIVACLTGVYDVPAAYARIRLGLSNTAPCSAYRGAGRPVMSYALERLVDQAALELGVDPAALRRNNLVRRKSFPYKTANGTTYDCGDFEGCLDRALHAADWAGFAARRKDAAARGRLLGRGIAAYIEATGAGQAPSDQVELRFDAAGGLALHAVSHSQGQGHETSFAAVLSGSLGIDASHVRLRSCDPAVPLTGNSTGGSRTMVGVGSVLVHAARKAIEAGLQHAAEYLEVAAADIEFAEGAYRVKGTDRAVTFAELVRRLGAGGAAPHPLDVRAELKTGATYPNGCHVAEVEIDPETGSAEILRYVAVDDGGNLVHPQIVEGQMMGGLTQGAGQVFGERAVYDPASGQLLSGSFMDYPMPRAVLVEGLLLEDHPVPTAANALGAKGIGEAGVTGALPCLMNAVADALRAAGVPHFDLPATPLRVWEALQTAHSTPEGGPRG